MRSIRLERALLWGGILGACTLSSALGEAKCKGPSTFIAPASGAAIPQKATLLVFVPRHREQPKVEVLNARGERLSVAIETLSKTPAFKTLALQLRAGSSKRVKVRLLGQYGRITEASYKVRSPWTPPANSGIEVLGSEEEHFRWTCSSQKSQNLRLTSAPGVVGFAVHWAESEALYRAGATQRFLVPTSMERFFGSKPKESVVELGQINCTGSTFDWKQPMIYLGITAVYVDASESPLASAPVALKRP